MSKETPMCPFKDAMIGDDPEEVTNPFSGAKCTLDPHAVATYDVLKGAEQVASMGIMSDKKTDELWDTVREGVDWFRKHYPAEYMTLLD